MAIVAILATAGLSAYTGYIKKARDSVRIADLAAINNIVLASMSSTGLPPQTPLELINAILAANNRIPIVDPLVTPATSAVTDDTITPSRCLNSTGSTMGVCEYGYYLCDGALGYVITARFESASNLSLYLSDAVASGLTESG